MKAECKKKIGMESRESVIRSVCWRREAKREEEEEGEEGSVKVEGEKKNRNEK